MGGDFSIIGRIKLAFAVMMRWETLVTLGAFIALWLLMSYVADPWRNEGRQSKPRAAKPPKKAADQPSEADSIEEVDELPD
jgi:hypothetical protein